MELKVSQDSLEGAVAFEKVHEKYSVSAKENRCYRHRFYQFLIFTRSFVTKNKGNVYFPKQAVAS